MDTLSTRAARTLQFSALALAVLTAGIQLYAIGGSEFLTPQGVVLASAPVALVALPLVLPAPLRGPGALANAIIVSVLMMLGGFHPGLVFLAPLALLLWAVVCVPWRLSRSTGSRERRVWGLLGAVAIALPAAVVVTSAMSGTVSLTVVAWLFVVAVLLAAAGYAAGFRVASVAVLAFGLVIMGATYVSPGMLIVATWWIGGLYASLGAIQIAAGRRWVDSRSQG